MKRVEAVTGYPIWRYLERSLFISFLLPASWLNSVVTVLAELHDQGSVFILWSCTIRCLLISTVGGRPKGSSGRRPK